MINVDESPDDMVAAVGEQLRALRVSRNIDQKTLAERAGISLRALRNLEGGQGSTLRSLVCTLAVSEPDAPPTERLLLVLHADPASRTLPLPPGTWQARLDSSGLLASQGVYRTRIEVPGCTVLLLVQALQTTHPERPPAFPAPIHPETL